MHALRRLRDEDGIALPVAMLTLMLIGTLSAMLAFSSIQSSATSVQAGNQGAALQAADAGLQAAIYRLDQQPAVPSADCFTTTGVTPTGGVCPAQTESAGNGGSFSYWVSPALTQGDSCTGYYVQAPNGQTVTQRCITALGTINGVKRRVQERVAGYQTSGGGSGGGSSFPIVGLLALGPVTATGSFALNGALGANGNISLPTGASVSGPIGYKNGTTVSPSSLCGPCYQVPGFWVPSASSYPAPYQQSQLPLPSQNGNNNAAIGWPIGAYNPVTRVVSASGSVGSASSPLTIPSGTYNFCELDLTQASYLQVAPGSRVTIFIDSPSRSGSGCTPGTGNVNVSGPLFLSTPPGDPTAFQIFAYGNPGGSPTTINFNDSLNQGPPSATLAGLIWAPDSAFTTSNAFTFAGAMVVRSFTSSNAISFTGQTGSATTNSGPFYPSAWHECPATPSGSDPGSGCAS